ncbi:MAG: carboxylesterase family protein, partial [Bacteroidia bacterium]
MRNLLLSTVLFSALPLFSQSGTYCIQNRFSETAFFDSSKITVVKDVVYSIPSKWPGSGVDTLKLDLYYPSDAAETLSKRPAIVFFYGGAWLFGNKNDAGIKQKCYEWARRGFVVAAPNYRLGWNCNASDLLGTCILCQVNYFDMNTAVYRGAQDAKAAMRFMVANQTSYKIDTSYLFIGGESAGSFNAMHA